MDEGNFSVDLICWLKSGQRLAYEIVNQSITNVAALAARLQGKGFSQVIFLVTDYNTKQRVWTSIKNAGFDPDFLATIRYQLFSPSSARKTNDAEGNAMSQKTIRNALIVFVIVFLLSPTGKILQFLSGLDAGGILTLAPLRNSPEDARFYITLAVFVLAFVTIFSVLQKRK